MTLGMDCTNEDHSPPLSDNTGSTWLNWENEISSISGLNIGSSPELNGLVEDKEVAARAVAFVVNSTRKGIVPLCADIANLLRAKRSLEKKVYLLKREVEALRSSTSVSFRTSHSTSPTPPLIEKSITAETIGLHERSRPCSRCSQCSSNVSNSPKLESTYSFKSYLPSPALSRDAFRRTSPRLARQPPKPPMGGVQQLHTAHTSPDISVSGPAGRPDLPARTQGRKNSLPEMTSEPNVEIKRISPKISKETQCTLALRGESQFEEQFIETVRLNSKLAEELGSAKKEIEILKGRLKELEMNQLARECTQDHLRQELPNEDFSSSELQNNSSPNTQDCQPKCVTNGHKHARTNGLSSSKVSTRVPPPVGSLHYAEPLYGCKCTACDEAMGGEIHAALSASLNEDLLKFPVSSKIVVQLGDHVVIKGEKTGRIRYIGHLDKIGQPNMVFVGLELDAPVGHHDGFFNKKRYFFCQKDHGIFIPLHDIICKVQPKMLSCSEKLASRSKDTSDILSQAVITLRGGDEMESKHPGDCLALVGMTSKSNHSNKSDNLLQQAVILSHLDGIEAEKHRRAEDLV
ncbi:uncharacterized protein LOC131954912 [Physella acuta]|uniref:uncharacterized protein LOC131954912 n=1 Tax=Physella acuta TaxID=109671 RepID=UPI0027DB71CE|nr:uncharacterized protein LOC131954912 [Physella acuta]